jgi:hypothetical protein
MKKVITLTIDNLGFPSERSHGKRSYGSDNYRKEELKKGVRDFSYNKRILKKLKETIAV